MIINTKARNINSTELRNPHTNTATGNTQYETMVMESERIKSWKATILFKSLDLTLVTAIATEKNFSRDPAW